MRTGFWSGALAILGGLVTLAGAQASGPLTAAQSSKAPRASAPAAAPRTPWGDPDLQGVYTTDNELGVPFERPPQFGTRQMLTDAEFAQRQTQAQAQAEADREEFTAARPVDATGPAAGGTGPPAHWLERGKPSHRTSIVIDPSDGRIPYVSDEARQRGAAATARTPEGIAFNGPEDLDLYDRCITRGFPHVVFPTIYDNTSQIVQGEGYVAIRYEMIHDARVISLDGRPHLSSGIRQYFGDSRGHWEGDTLVVDVTNFPNRVNYRGSGPGLHVVERFRRVDDNSIRYELTVEDPTTFQRPWTAALTLERDPRQVQVFEYACHEGNYAMTNILSGARRAEAAK